MRTLVTLAMSATVLALSSSAFAAASLLTGVRVVACAQDLAFQDCEQAIGVTGADIQAVRAGALGTASGQAVAGFGNLGAGGTMTATVNGAEGGVNASGSVEAQAIFSDVLELFVLPGNDIAPGTPITLRAILELHDVISLTSPDSGRAVARLDLNLLTLFVEDAEPGGASPPDKRASGEIIVPFGNPINLSGQLLILGSASCQHSGPCPGGGAIQAFDTALSFVDVVTPGVGYRTESGVTYASTTAVPWPSTLVVLGVGLLSIALRRRSR